jgi:Streptomyces sporulation and cell division protein, SsgA
MSQGVAEMSSIDRSTVVAEQDLRLVGPDEMVVPLTADLRYSRQDPYAVRMSLDTYLDEPVRWILSRDLLTAALHAPEGIGDVRAWPSAEPGAGEKVLNIELGPPSGSARFEVSAAEIGAFLAQTYELVPAGQESGYLNLDAGLAELLSQA